MCSHVFSPISSGISNSLAEGKGKWLHLELNENVSQMTTKSSSSADNIHACCLVLSMQKNHCLSLQIQHTENEHQLQLQHDRMQYETTNAQVIHDQVIVNKQVKIQLEEAKACAAAEVVCMKQQEVEMLCLQLMLKGINPST